MLDGSSSGYDDHRKTMTVLEKADAPRSVGRRPLLVGAAWSVPAIAMTVSAPAYAASGAVLTFNRSSYDTVACSPLNGVAIAVKNGGAPASGVAVTTSLSTGWTFASTGAASYVGTTDSTGTVTLPAISSPAGGGTTTITATISSPTFVSQSSNAKASVANGLGALGLSRSFTSSTGWNGVRAFAQTVPVGTKVAFGPVMHTADNRLVYNDGTTLATNVSQFGQAMSDGASVVVPLRLTDGSAATLSLSPNMSSVNALYKSTAVPSGSTPAFGPTFLTSDKRIMHNNGTPFTTGVVEGFGQAIWDGSNALVPVITTDGSVGTLVLSGGMSTAAAYYQATAVPNGSKPAFGATFLTSDNRLMYNDGTALTTAVVTGFGQAAWDGASILVPLTTTDGSVGTLSLSPSMSTVNAYYQASSVPAGSKPLAGPTFLTGDNRVMYNDGTALTTAVVVGAGQALSDGSSVLVPLRTTDGSVGTLSLKGDFLNVNAYYQADSRPYSYAPRFGNVFLSSTGDLLSADGILLKPGVADLGQPVWDGSSHLVPLLLSDNSLGTLALSANMASVAGYFVANVPAGSRPAFGSVFLTSDKRLVSNDGTAFTTGVVDRIGQAVSDGSNILVPLITTDTSVGVLSVTSGMNAANAYYQSTAVPAGSKPAFGPVFLTGDRRLMANDGTALTTGVVMNFGQAVSDGSAILAPIATTDGSTGTLSLSPSMFSANAYYPSAAVPTNSMPLWGDAFLTPSKSVVLNDGTVIATNVEAHGYAALSGSEYRVPLSLGSC